MNINLLHLSFKSHWAFTVPGADPHTCKGGNRPIYNQETVVRNLIESQISFYSNSNTPKQKKDLKLTWKLNLTSEKETPFRASEVNRKASVSSSWWKCCFTLGVVANTDNVASRRNFPLMYLAREEWIKHNKSLLVKKLIINYYLL